MRRGKAKGKKLSVTNQDDPGSGEEEKIPVQKRRGRPQKLLKDENDMDDAKKLEDEGSEDTTGVLDKDMKSNDLKKRKRNDQVKLKADSPKEETMTRTVSNSEGSNISNGFRHNGSRRKNKPRRAAESVVECI